MSGYPNKFNSGGGTLYGKLLHHPAALASTIRIDDRVPLEEPHTTMRQVAQFPRGAGQLPYRVIHDSTVMRPFGRYAVYVGQRRVGSQLSHPSADDCRRMENPPAPAQSVKVELSKTTRASLGLLKGDEREEHQARHREYAKRARGTT